MPDLEAAFLSLACSTRNVLTCMDQQGTQEGGGGSEGR